jgi:hypothetical protein
MAVAALVGESADTIIVRPDGSAETRAKDPRSLGQGSWIRYRTRSKPNHLEEGWVESLSDGVIEVAESGRSAPVRLRADDLQALQLRGPGIGRSGGAEVGAGLGIVVGLIAGGVIGHQNEPDCTPNSWFCMRGLPTIGGALLGGAIGAAAGALIGLAVTPDGWIDVPIGSLEVRSEGRSIAARMVAQ